MSDKPMTREQAEKELRNKIQAICKVKNLTELEVVRMMATLPAYRKVKKSEQAKQETIYPKVEITTNILDPESLPVKYRRSGKKKKV